MFKTHRLLHILFAFQVVDLKQKFKDTFRFKFLFREIFCTFYNAKRYTAAINYAPQFTLPVYEL